MYEFWLFLHIAAAIVWVGGGTVLGVLMGKLEKAQAGPALAGIGQQMEAMSKSVFIPASIVALIAGVAMVLTSDAWDWEDPWIAIGVAGFLVTMAVGMAVIGPTAKKMGVLAAEKGPQDPEVAAMRKRMKTFTSLNTLVLWLVVLDMVVKPGA